MTEKERPSSPQPDHIQQSNYQPEDEISLLDLLEVLVRKKALIFITASFFTALSIFYALSITPIYRSTIGFQPNEKSLASLFPPFAAEILPSVPRSEKGSLVGKNNYLLNKFLTEFQSYSIQEKVFNEGAFLQKFVDSNPNSDMGKGIVQELNRSIHASDSGKGISAQTITVEMEGAKPEVMSDFLNALADQTKSEVVIDVKESIRQGIKIQMDMFSAELEKIRSQEKAGKADKIRLFSDNLEIAKNLGILDNNFGNSPANTSLIFGERTKANIPLILGERPIWYLYGQRAIEQELKVLERREVSGQYIEETAELDHKIAYLSGIDLSKINFEPVIISQFSVPPVHPINSNKIKTIASGIALGLFIGILIAFLSNSMALLKKRSQLSPPQ